MITIRMAIPADAALIAKISRQTFYETFADSNTTSDMDKFMNEQFNNEVLMKEVETPGAIFFLAYDDEEPVGYVRLRDGEHHPEFKGALSIEIARIYAVKKSIEKELAVN